MITTTDKGHLDAFAETDSGALEIVGKPEDIAEFVKRIRHALTHRA